MDMISKALFKTLEGEVGGEPKSREVGSAFRLCEVLGVPGYRRGMERGGESALAKSVSDGRAESIIDVGWTESSYLGRMFPV